jgi:hypothetical protein
MSLLVGRVYQNFCIQREFLHKVHKVFVFLSVFKSLFIYGIFLSACSQDFQVFIKKSPATVATITTPTPPQIGVRYVQSPIVNNQDDLIVIPPVRYSLTANNEESFLISNRGEEPLEILSIEVPTGFSVVDSPKVILSDVAQPFKLKIKSDEEGVWQGHVQIFSNDPDTPIFRFPISAKISRFEVRRKSMNTELLLVEKRKVDVLFVMDDSTSMQQEISVVRESIHSFIDQFKNKNLDYRIALTSTSSNRSSDSLWRNLKGIFAPFMPVGTFNAGGLPGPGSLLTYTSRSPRYFSSSANSPDEIASEFRNMTSHLATSIGAGVGGSGHEAGLFAAARALNQNSAVDGSVAQLNQGFVRADAQLAMIIISDEDESIGSASGLKFPNGSDIPGNHYVKFNKDIRDNRIKYFIDTVKNLKPDRPDLLRLDAIVGTPEGKLAKPSCPIASENGLSAVGDVYIEAVALINNGKVIDLCQNENFGAELVNIGSDISVHVQRRFTLNPPPVTASEANFQVFLNNHPIAKSITNGWSYDSKVKEIVLHGLHLEDISFYQVRVEYNYLEDLSE